MPLQYVIGDNCCLIDLFLIMSKLFVLLARLVETEQFFPHQHQQNSNSEDVARECDLVGRWLWQAVVQQYVVSIERQ